MSDDQAEQLEQPELLSIAEALTEHANMMLRVAFDRWYDSKPAGWLCGYTHQGKALQGWEAGWRAALEWYIALVTRPPLTELAIATTRRSVDRAAGAAGEHCEVGECGWLLRPGILPEYPLGMWCHRPEAHGGGHLLGH